MSGRIIVLNMVTVSTMRKKIYRAVIAVEMRMKCTLGDHCLHYMEGDGDCCDCGEKLVFCENCGWVEISGEEHMDKWGC